MVVDTKWYDLLGVPSNATEGQIRKAYHKLALNWHPDKNPSEEAKIRFNEISEAAKHLMNSETRAIYDQHGEQGIRAHLTNQRAGVAPGMTAGMGVGGMGPGFGAGSFMSGVGGFPFPFAQMFGHNPFFAGAFPNQSAHPQQSAAHPHSRASPPSNHSPHVEISLPLTLEECYTGGGKIIEMKRKVVCQACQGSGAENGEQGQSQCTDCQGHGRRVLHRTLAPGIVANFESGCEMCKGTGKIIQTVCEVCQGKTVLEELKTWSLMFEPGAYDGQMFRFEGYAHETPHTHRAGDVIVTLRTANTTPTAATPPTNDARCYTVDCFTISSLPAEPFQNGLQQVVEVNHLSVRDADGDLMERIHTHHLLVRRTISLWEALFGFELTVRHLDGRLLNVYSPFRHVCADKDVLVVEKKGMPVCSQTSDSASSLIPPVESRGHLFIVVSIEMPKYEEIEMYNTVRPSASSSDSSSSSHLPSTSSSPSSSSQLLSPASLLSSSSFVSPSASPTPSPSSLNTSSLKETTSSIFHALSELYQKAKMAGRSVLHASSSSSSTGSLSAMPQSDSATSPHSLQSTPATCLFSRIASKDESQLLSLLNRVDSSSRR